MEALRALLAAAALVAAIGCTAAPICADGVDQGLKSSGSCGPDVTVTVRSGNSCAPSAYTGFNSELAGFPQATNDDHPVIAEVDLADGGSQSRSCRLKAAGDAGAFTVSCELCGPATPDAGCSRIGECEATLVP